MNHNLPTPAEHIAIERAQRLLAESIAFRTGITKAIHTEIANSVSSGAREGNWSYDRDKQAKLDGRTVKFRLGNVNKLLSSDHW